MTHDEMIAVIQAHKEGKKIEVSLKGADFWSDRLMGGTNFDFIYCDYRVAKTKKVGYIGIGRYDSGAPHIQRGTTQLYYDKSLISKDLLIGKVEWEE